MSPVDLAFILGPLGAPVVGISSIIALAVAQPAARARWLAVALLAVTALAWLTYWVLWGQGFDRVDAGLDPGTSLETAMNGAIWVTAAGSVALAITLIGQPRRPPASS